MSPQRPPHNPIAAIFRELRWLNGWMAAMILFGLVLALLERAGVGVTLSPSGTALKLNGNAVLGGSVTVPAGAYTLYMMPVENGASQLVFSKNVGKWGIPVDTASDVAKVDLKKSALSPANDQLTLAVQSAPVAAPAAGAAPANPTVTLRIMWEATEYSVDFAVKQ